MTDLRLNCDQCQREVCVCIKTDEEIRKEIELRIKAGISEFFKMNQEPVTVDMVKNHMLRNLMALHAEGKIDADIPIPRIEMKRIGSTLYPTFFDENDEPIQNILEYLNPTPISFTVRIDL